MKKEDEKIINQVKFYICYKIVAIGQLQTGQMFANFF